MPPSADEIAREFVQESIHLLEQSLHKIHHCLDQLNFDQLWWRPEPELNSIGNLMLHLCGNLNQWAVCGLTNAKDERQREQEFSADVKLSLEEIRAKLDQTVTQACETVQSLSATALLEPRIIQGFSVTVMGAISHTVPHFVGHTHQIIFLTRLQKGTDYQFDWSPDSHREGVPIQNASTFTGVASTYYTRLTIGSWRQAGEICRRTAVDRRHQSRGVSDMSRKARRSDKKSNRGATTSRKEVKTQFAASSTQPGSDSFELGSKRISTSEIFFLTVLVLWSFLVSCFPLRNMDIWWHLRTGELILERGTVPYYDWFTFVDFDRPWIDLHWGFQILVTWLYRWGGVDLLILTKAFCLALTIGIAWFASGKFVPSWLKALLWILPVICISGRSLVRPEMLSLVYLSFWMYVLSRAASQPKLIWLIPLITLFWVNSHALFVLGLVISILFIVDHLVRTWAQGRWGLELPSTAISGMTFIRVGVFTILACFLNPYLEQGVLFPLTLYEKFSTDQAFYSIRIGEFQPPFDFIRKNGLRNLYLISQVVLAVLTLASFFPLLMKKRVNLFRILLFIAFTHLAWKASRNTGVFSLISGIILSDNISDWIRLSVSRSSVTESETASHAAANKQGLSPGKSRWQIVSACTFLFLIGSLCLGYWNRWGGEGRVLGLGEQEAWYAHAASKFAGQPGMPHRAFISNMGQAAVYIFHNGPEKKVFFDGRLEVNTKETFQLYEEIKQLMSAGKADWAYLLMDEQGQLPIVILDSRYSRNEIRGMGANPGWRLVFADQAAAVFLDNKTADRLHLPEADPTPLFQPPGMQIRQ